MRSAGAWVAVVLVACGGSEAGLLADGGFDGGADDGGPGSNADADYLLTDVFESVVNPNNVSCPHPSPVTRVGLVRSGRWTEGGPGDGSVSTTGEVSYRGEAPQGTIARTAQIHANGTVTGTLTFAQANCSGTYTTTGHRR